ncbi:MAG: hypothetical protein HY319_06795 [Armatimonadetes bacterium]|nr:hypothetical protein [Armatimonadota bacterium]
MAYSNNPENIRRFSGDQPMILFRESLPAGSGRVFVSHFNTSWRPLDLVLAWRNPDPAGAAHVTFGRYSALAGGLWPEPGIELWRTFRAAPAAGSLAVPASETVETRIRSILGNGLVMADLELDRPLEMTASLAPTGYQGGHGVLAPRSAPSRGGFFRPPTG